jgi:predicted Rossmann fold nucleotide-binding protein DprA/Smf involved in DNA uptake
LISRWEAKIVTNANDILSEFNIRNKENKAKEVPNFIDEESKKIYDLLLLESLNVDEISLKLNLNISFVLLKISMLELSSLVRKNDTGKYEVI